MMLMDDILDFELDESSVGPEMENPDSLIRLPEVPNVPMVSAKDARNRLNLMKTSRVVDSSQTVKEDIPIKCAPERQTVSSVSPPSRDPKSRPFHLKRYVPYERNVHMHEKCLGVLCIQENGYSLTNGVETISWDGEVEVDPQQLLKDVIFSKVGYMLTADEDTYKTWKSIVAKLDSIHPIKYLNVMKLNVKEPLGICLFCTKQCHRFKVVTGGFCQISHVPLDIVPH
ncbi:uncharacterized protein [Parasteatoda tepidariorum]|uniref:uncharacterized protein n=1 Tax=Parasteatoda tepidariorum TaxID=114398 RepID=UPI001C71FB41|nr:uncharacterized protein LOC107439746 [Parasteatoda tepidariorum]